MRAGVTIREIQHHLAARLGIELSHETISNITEAVMDEVAQWQDRSLEAFYPVIFLDAVVVKVRDQNRDGEPPRPTRRPPWRPWTPLTGA
jgi:transposase, mutator family